MNETVAGMATLATSPVTTTAPRLALRGTVPLALLVAAFLPYLPGGLRTEHLLALAGTALAFLAFVAGRWRLPWPAVALAMPLLVSVAAALVSSAGSTSAGSAAPVASSALRLALPPLLVLAGTYALARVPDLLHRTAAAVVIVAAPVGLVSMLSAVADIAPLLAPWVRGGDDSVWAQSREIGRFTGVFNQPLEAGTFFTVATCALVYLRSERRVRGGLLLAALIPIFLGGALSLSKNFLVVGLGCGLGLAVWLGVISVAGAVARALVGGALLIAALFQFADAYVTSLVEVFDTGGLLLALTAGRFGSDETDVSFLFAELRRQAHWVSGFGLGAHLPLDNGYLEYFYQGGVVALAGYLVALAALAWMGMAAVREPRGKLVLTLLAYVIVASSGGPVLTANRANVALIALVLACLLDRRGGRGAWPEPSTRGRALNPARARAPDLP